MTGRKLNGAVKKKPSADAVRELKGIHRVPRITPGENPIEVLLKDGLDSAQANAPLRAGVRSFAVSKTDSTVRKKRCG